jgi:hypothetical protein
MYMPAMSDGDRVMLWLTLHGTHIGNGFPSTCR